MQFVGYGMVMPAYATVHVLISPIARPNAPIPMLAKQIQVCKGPALNTLTKSIGIGFIIPAILMSLPTFSSKTHQYLVVVWQLFPIWISSLQAVLPIGYRYFVLASDVNYHRPFTRTRMATRTPLDKVYRFALTVCTLTQSSSVVAILLAKAFPSALLQSGLGNVTFSNVFLPQLNFHSNAKINNMVQGAQHFFQYDQYVGSLAAIVWVVILSHKCQVKSLMVKGWLRLMAEILGLSLIAGPAGAFLVSMKKRDQQIFHAAEQLEAAKDKQT